MSSRVTMSDVARRAGVSLMTVSRVINHKGDVNAETRQRVLDVIQQLDYRPSAIARSLATQKTRTIGLVLPDVSNPFFADIAGGIEHLANAEGYHLFLCNTEEDAQRELALIQSLAEKQVDGLILCSSRLDEKLLVPVLRHFPAVVLVNRRLDGGNDELFDSVMLDDVDSGRAATQHLIRRGHQRIGFLAGPAASFSGRARQRGYLEALAASALPAHPGWVTHCPPSVEGGHQFALRLLNQHPQLTALFCYNDLVAVGVLQAGAELGWRIPRDLVVVGHDDIPLAALVSPALTTCRVQRKEMGVQAVQFLMERLGEYSEGFRRIILKPELVIRQSAP